MSTQPGSDTPNDESESNDTKKLPAARPQVVRPRARAAGRSEFWLALAGIVATFVTGVVVQSFTYDSNRTLNAEQFKTTERKAAYGDLISKTSALDDAELHAHAAIFSPIFGELTVEDEKRWSEELDRDEDARRRFHDAAAEVELVASAEVLEKAQKVELKHYQLLFVIGDQRWTNTRWLLDPAEHGADHKQDLDAADKKFDEKLSALTSAEHDFLFAARENLGIGLEIPPPPRLSELQADLLRWSIFGGVIGLTGAYVFRRYWLSLILVGFSLYMVWHLLRLYGQTTAINVGVAIALGLAPLVVYEKWKAIGPPPIVERTRQNARRREAERLAKCEAKRNEKQRAEAVVRSGGDESSR